ncbi:MAG: hypothetical protein MJ202_08500 [Lentisphaeria bacterium]|nr:hypothetical protein [Lentisphaeria bacterium]
MRALDIVFHVSTPKRLWRQQGKRFKRQVSQYGIGKNPCQHYEDAFSSVQPFPFQQPSNAKREQRGKKQIATQGTQEMSMSELEKRPCRAASGAKKPRCLMKKALRPEVIFFRGKAMQSGHADPHHQKKQCGNSAFDRRLPSSFPCDLFFLSPHGMNFFQKRKTPLERASFPQRR